MDTERLNQIKKSMELLTTSMISRGGVIDLAIAIESVLADIIAWCFYPTEKEWNVDLFDQLDENGIILRATLLRRLEFFDKINILKTVIIAKNLLPMAKHKSLIKQITKDLNDIRDFRNLLVHSPLDLSTDTLKSLTCETTEKATDAFQVIEYRGGKTIKHRIDIPRIKLEMNKMTKCWYRLLQLFALLKGDTEDARACEILSNMTEEDTDYVLKHLGLKG